MAFQVRAVSTYRAQAKGKDKALEVCLHDSIQPRLAKCPLSEVGDTRQLKSFRLGK